MKLFSWMQNKFNGGGQLGKKVQTKNQANQERPRNEEFNGWPDSLLAIGTFGASSSSLNAKSETTENIQNQNDNEILEDTNYYNEQSSSLDLTEFTPEEVGKLQKELTKLLSKKPAAAAKLAAAEGRQDGNLPLDRFLNCPSSLEVDRRTSSRFSSTNSEIYENLDEQEIDRTIRAIIGRCKDHVCKTNNKKTVNGMKSVSFLLKKMFVCSSGFTPTPNLYDAFPESRMEKLLRTILSKKIIPQSSSRISTKRYLEERCAPKEETEEKKREKTCDGSKWVKTDSDFIVLEI
ncbi:protein NEGATIVE GRAVITROPIC RESPONSE OF ROOTS-like [Solanum dulcamara]|uniref:protein NEGATIVE GRAVITROPIC RESPONSE OF ROOTS-like n=1 Tax=Solanum dulcamara TaxID=45834 RepID=UPI002485BCCF|nr:protein NEGATIVE GRAVITROPIC RESPONSE OF ROOTS-like [Solanum dulcamara]